MRGGRAAHTQVKGLEGRILRQVACGWRHTVAVDLDGVLYSFGWSKYGQLGHGDHQCAPALGPPLAKSAPAAAGWASPRARYACRVGPARVSAQPHARAAGGSPRPVSGPPRAVKSARLWQALAGRATAAVGLRC